MMVDEPKCKRGHALFGANLRTDASRVHKLSCRACRCAHAKYKYTKGVTESDIKKYADMKFDQYMSGDEGQLK